MSASDKAARPDRRSDHFEVDVRRVLDVTAMPAGAPPQARPGDYSEQDLQIVLGISPAELTQLVSKAQLPEHGYVWRGARYWSQDAIVSYVKQRSAEYAARNLGAHWRGGNKK